MLPEYAARMPTLLFQFAAFGKSGVNCTVHMWIWRGDVLLASGFTAWLSPGEHREFASGVASSNESGSALCAHPRDAWSLSALCTAAGVKASDLSASADSIERARVFFVGE